MAPIQNVRPGPSWLWRLFQHQYSPVHSSGDANPPTWRPRPLRTPYFLLFIFLCTLLIIAIEGIIHGCSRSGCHIFGRMSDTEVSRQSNLVYSLVPTAISVALGIFWAVPHHDIMRLEPYFQMSTEDVGATAEDSLLLGYPYTFAPLVPFISGRRRHYVVLLSSCILLIMNFFITPLISSIFNLQTLVKDVPGTGIQRPLYADHSTRNTTASFAYEAYSHRWLGQPLPLFTGSTYALLPVLNQLRLDNETWSAATTMYNGNVTCEDATVNLSFSHNIGGYGTISTRSGNISLQFCDIDSMRADCPVEVTFLTPWTMIVGLPSPFSNGPQTYLIAWARNTNLTADPFLPGSQQQRNITALACTTSYYSQNVTARFGGSGIVFSISTVGEPRATPFLDTKGFTTAISGVPYSIPFPSNYTDTRGDISLGYIPPLFPITNPPVERKLGQYTPNDTKINDPFSYMMGPVYPAGMAGLAGFALYNETPHTLKELLNHSTLKESFENAVQMLFAFWVALELIGNDEVEIPIMRHVWARGFTTNVVSARGVQGGLAVVSVMAALLCVLISRRRCELDGEPNSLAEGLRLLSYSPELVQNMENSEFRKLEDISQSLGSGGRRYLLDQVPGKGPRIRVVMVADPAQNTKPISLQVPALLPPTQKPDEPWVEGLWALKTTTGVGFVIYFGAVVALLCTMFRYAQGHKGLPTFAPVNSHQYKLLFSYLPVIVSRAMESILVTISTGHCMLAPYLPLIRGSSPSARSLTVDFDKSPPQFQLLRSSYWRNTTTAALAILILLSNVIAVTFSGLFSPIETIVTIEIQVVAPASLGIIGNFTQLAQEMYYILSANLTDHNLAPNWTTPEYYILPFFPVDSRETIYEGETWGIGIDVTCEIITVDQKNSTCIVPYNPGPGRNACQNGYGYVFSVNDPCWVNGSLETLTYTSDDFMSLSSICPGTLFAIWAQTLSSSTVETIALKCTSSDSIVELNALVNQEQVNSISKIPQRIPSEIVSMYDTNSTDDSQLAITFAEVLSLGTDMVFLDPFRLTWINHLMVALEPSINQNGSYVTHIPNATNLGQTFAEIYRRLFVINMSLYADEIVSVRRNNTMPAKGEMRTVRVQMNKLMYIISTGILSLTVTVLVLFYGRHRQQIRGHLPTTLAGVYVHLYASNSLEDCGQIVGRDPKIRAQRLAELNKLYRFGEFEGKDGMNHNGIYRVDKEEVVANENY